MGPGRWVASYLRMVPQNSAFSQSPKQQISSSFPLRRQLKAKTKGVNIWTCRVLGTSLWSTPESSSNLTSYKVPVKLSSQVAKQFHHPEPHRDKRRIFLCTGTSNKYDQIQDYGNSKLLQWKLFMFCTKENLATDQKKHEKTHWNVGRTWQIKLVSKSTTVSSISTPYHGQLVGFLQKSCPHSTVSFIASRRQRRRHLPAALLLVWNHPQINCTFC